MQEKPVSYFLGRTRLDTEHNQLFLVRCTILIYWIILLSVVTCRLCCEAVMHSLSSTPFCRLLECECCAVLALLVIAWQTAEQESCYLFGSR